MKRTFFCLLFSLNTYLAFSTFNVNGLKYDRLSNDTVTFVGCDSTMLEENHISCIIIPSKITYSDTCYQVVSMGYYEVMTFGKVIFEKYPTVTDISIPSSLIYFFIDQFTHNVFDSYPNLKTITVSNDNKIFKSVDGVLFDKKVEVLIKCPYQINVTSYSVPISVKLIVDNAFSNCKELQNINIPASVKIIDNNNFKSCNNLQKINVDKENFKYNSINGVLFNKNKTVLIKYPTGINNSTYKIPASVKTIEKNAFSDNISLNHIEIPSTVDTIKGNAFENCKGLKDITFPSSISTIESNAFKSCTSLSSVIILSSKTKFKPEVFANCDSLNTVVFPPDQSAIENEMFKNCTGLSNFIIPASIHSIGINAFQGCTGLKELILPANINKVGSGAFEDCTGIKRILLPNSLTTIETGTFKGCTGITEINIPSSIKHISAKAFKGCTSIKSVIIPTSVLSIGYEAFTDCTNLIDIQYPNSHISLGLNVFNNTAYLNGQPSGIVYLNKTAYTVKGKLRAQTIEFKEGTTGIADYAFCNQDLYFDLKIPNTIHYIGSHAFENCKYLKKNISFPLSLYYIGDKAFYNCSDLPNISIPSSVKYIGNEAFHHCYNLKEIQISDSTDFIGYNVFSNTIWYDNQPDGLIYIGSKLYKFKGKMPEKFSIDIRTGTTTIIGGAFRGCDNLEKISIPTSITEIGDKAFENCTGLHSITLAQSVTTIGDYAFLGCSALSSIYILASKPIKFFNTNYKLPSIPFHMFTNAVLNTQSELLDDFFNQVYDLERTAAHGNGIFAFNGINKDICTLYVPIGSKYLYEHADHWKEFKKIVEFDTSSRK